MDRWAQEARAKALAAAPEAEAWERAQPEYIEAEAYVRAMGHDGFTYVARLYDQLERGEMLTPQQVEKVQRSRKADIRAAAMAYRAAKRQEERAKAAINVYIPPEVVAGEYAVEVGKTLYHVTIERPQEGILRGFVRVTIRFGEETEVEGVQYPQPYVERADYRQTYRGQMAHIVAALVANPTGARERYEAVA